MDIKSVDIKAFLDGVDTVLNSNTFLLNTSVCFKSRDKAAEELFKFIKSNNFIAQVLDQDLIRGWRNYQQNEPLVKQYLVKHNFSIELWELSQEGALKYLKAMLTVEDNPYNFWSPYNTKMDESTAKHIVRNFLEKLTQGQRWKLFRVNTDFCYSEVDQCFNEKVMAYFGGDGGSDSAALIIREDQQAFLLLTNGRD